MAASVVSSRARLLGGAVAMALIVVLALVASTRDRNEAVAGLPADVPSNDKGLRTIARTAVFFGHQSVGGNILDGVPLLYTAAGVEAPLIVESGWAPAAEAAFAHAYVGKNGDPIGKVSDFAQKVRASYGDWARIAFLKFCYVDILSGTDVDAVFAEYKLALAQLQEEFPEATFLHLTVPLTTEPGLKTKLKLLVGKGTDHSLDNVARERYNALIRAEYGGTGLLVDVAAMESTKPDGSRVSGEVDGDPYFSLFDGFASDPGHLNEVGSQVVAAGLLDVMGANLND